MLNKETTHITSHNQQGGIVAKEIITVFEKSNKKENLNHKRAFFSFNALIKLITAIIPFLGGK